MKYIAVAIMMILWTSGSSQQEEVIVPFSSPNDAKSIDIQLFSGAIVIKGSDRNDVLVKYSIEERGDDEDVDDKDDKSKGMRKIGGGNFRFEIGEKNNEVRITSQNFMNMIRMEIEVPKSIDIDLQKNIGEDVLIENISGIVNVENNVGSVTINNLSGSVNASSSTGEIKVVFGQIDKDQNMSFNTITGSIDLTLPNSYNADLKMRTEWGEIYSDLEIDARNEKQPATQTDEDNGMKIISNNWTLGTLNNGGPEMTVRTQMGSIYLRSKE